MHLAVLRSDDRDKATTLQRLFDEIYIKDIARRHDVRKKRARGAPKYSVLFCGIADKSRKTEKHVSQREKVERHGTIKRYIDYFEDSFLIESANRYDIQSAYSIPDEEKREQEIGSFRMINDSFRKIIVTRDTARPWYDENGIMTVSIYDFLLDGNILG